MDFSAAVHVLELHSHYLRYDVIRNNVSYDVVSIRYSHYRFSRETFHTTNVYILFSPEVESAQLVLKLDIAHFVHVI